MANPEEGLYTLQVSNVFINRDVPNYSGDGTTDRIRIVVELLGTENPDDENRPFRASAFLNKSNSIHFNRDGQKTLTKAGKFLKTVVGELPFPLYYEKVNFEALVGTYFRGMVTTVERKKGEETKVYANFKPDATLPTKDEEQLAVNADRKALILSAPPVATAA